MSIFLPILLYISGPALRSCGPSVVLCKTCSVLLYVLEHSRVDNSSTGSNQFKASTRICYNNTCDLLLIVDVIPCGLVSQPSVFSFDLQYFLNDDNHTRGGVKIAIFGQSIFYLACFNCELILIEHRNKHIATFFDNWYTL